MQQESETSAILSNSRSLWFIFIQEKKKAKDYRLDTSAHSQRQSEKLTLL